MTDGYRAEDLFPASEFPEERTLLLTGPSRGTVAPVAARLLAAGRRPADGVVQVVTDQRVARSADNLGRAADAPGGLYGVIDCTHGERRWSTPEDLRWYTTGPADFTGTGIAMDQCRRRLDARGARRVHVVFDTLSTLLVSLDADSVCRHANYLATGDGLGLFPVYTNVTDGTAVERLKHLFDGLVEVRRRGGVREVRCAGFPGTPTGWVPLARDWPGAEDLATPESSDGDGTGGGSPALRQD